MLRRDHQTTGEDNLTRQSIKFIRLPERNHGLHGEPKKSLAIGIDRVDGLDQPPRLREKNRAHNTHHDTDTTKQRLVPYGNSRNWIPEDNVGVVHRVAETECRKTVGSNDIAAMRRALEQEDVSLSGDSAF